jgi:glutamate N-acetyltransferase/amino-acid N-acetyltransferase
MLVYLFTDVAAAPAELKRLLKTACDSTFNCISVDGDTSTNDTVLLMASGASGCSLKQRGVEKQFAKALQEVCASLAEQIVSDGEGVKHVVRLQIEQARSVDEARRIARAIANSPLIKTAWAGCDPNWGRILAAVGYSGVALDPARVNMFIGKQQVCRKGAACGFDQRAAHQYMSQPSYDIRVQLGRGRASLQFLTCDLTAEYVHINAEYST